MPRLSDRAFQIVKNEIDRCYTDSPADQIERIILLARLQTLRARKGKPMTRAQIWEELSDIAPNFDQNVLIEAANIDTDSPLVGASIGIGAVAMLVSTAVGMETVMANAPAVTPDPNPTKTTENKTEKNEATKQNRLTNDDKTLSAKNNAPSIKTNLIARLTRATTALQRQPQKAAVKPGNNKADENAFETAKSFGWKAALKSQNPPHTAEHWGEAAALWKQALSHLDNVPQQDPNYTNAQIKKVLYQRNLEQIEGRQRAVQLANQKVTPAAQSATAATSAAAPKPTAVPVAAVSTSQQSASQQPATQTAAAQASANQTPQFSKPIEDPLKIAKEYGWQAAVASQNAPHPPEKWADISRLWQTALLNLEKIDAEHPNYSEAQQVKTRYQANLSAIRQRYQQEQSATQRLQSLQATLDEIESTLAPGTSKYSKLQAIVARLRTIPAGTQAHKRAQKLIAETTGQMNAIAANPSTKVVLSAND